MKKRQAIWTNFLMRNKNACLNDQLKRALKENWRITAWRGTEGTRRPWTSAILWTRESVNWWTLIRICRNRLGIYYLKYTLILNNTRFTFRPNPRDGISAPPELPSVPAEFNPTVPPPGFGHPSPYSYPSQQPSFMPPPNATFGQSLSFSEPSPYSVQAGGYGASGMLTAPAQFGSFYANQSPAPHGLGTPPARWQQCDNFRWVWFNLLWICSDFSNIE